MVTLELHGRITEAGSLEIELPSGLPAGEVMLRIDVPENDWEHQPWTEDEPRELMIPDPQSGAEIAAWLEANPPTNPNWGDITDDADVADYVHHMRREKQALWDETE